MEYNQRHGIEPVGIQKTIRDISSRIRAVAEASVEYNADGSTSYGSMPKDEMARLVKDLELQMKQAAKDLEFEKAALIRDQVIELRRLLASDDPVVPKEWLAKR
jgi:excinuclease ABC subunit B